MLVDGWCRLQQVTCAQTCEEEAGEEKEEEVNGEGGQHKWVAPVILECLHVFHASCVEEWFRRRERSGVKCLSVRV